LRDIQVGRSFERDTTGKTFGGKDFEYVEAREILRGTKTRRYILLVLDEVSVAPGVVAVLAGVAITHTVSPLTLIYIPQILSSSTTTTPQPQNHRTTHLHQ